MVDIPLIKTAYDVLPNSTCGGVDDTLLHLDDESMATMDDSKESSDVQSDGFQVECGIFKHYKLPFDALILSQGWPSWTFAIEGLGFRSVSTLAYFDSITSRDEFKSTEAGNTLIAKHRLESWLKLHCPDGIVFIQGDPCFFKTFSDSYSNYIDNLRIVFSCTDQAWYIKDGIRVSHSQVGGVTDGEWTIIIENLICSLSFTSKVHRTLAHFLSTMEGESSAKSVLSSSSNQLLKGNDKLPWNNGSVMVLAKSVFHKSNMIKRFLSYSELMDCYDVELSVQQSLKRFNKVKGARPTKSFVKQIPIKVLRSIATNIVIGLSNELYKGETQDDSDYDSDTTVLQSNSTITTCRDDESVYSLDSQGLAGEVNMSLNDVAAKPDDAEAEPSEWDAWSVSSFVNNTSTPPLVCHGDYDEVTHS